MKKDKETGDVKLDMGEKKDGENIESNLKIEEKEEFQSVNLFDTHRFLFTLNYNNQIKEHKVLFVNRDNVETIIELEKIDIGASPVSCKLYDKEGNRYLVPFVRIRKIFLKDELVWDNSDSDLSNVKVIKGFSRDGR